MEVYLREKKHAILLDRVPPQKPREDDEVSHLSRVQAKYNGLNKSYDCKTYRSSLASKFEDAKSRLLEV